MTAIDESILQLSGDESRDMWEDINSIKPVKLRHIIYHIMCHTQNAEYRLYDTIKALTERVDEHIKWHERGGLIPKKPPTGPIRFGPVLNDGKADTEKLVQKYIDRCVDENIIYMEHIDRHKVLMRQLIAESQAQEWLNARKLPFDTGLSVLDSLKK